MSQLKQSSSSSKKRKSSSDATSAKRAKSSSKRSSNNNSNKKTTDNNLKLFQTLSALEQTDQAAKKSRQSSLKSQYNQSLASNDLMKIHLTLVEMRILVQRSFSGLNAMNVNDGDDVNQKASRSDAKKVQTEIDALLENLLVARKDLLGDQLLDDTSGNNSNDGVDYETLIQNDNEATTEDDSSRDENEISLASTLQSEYQILQSQWKSTLNKHHANLQLSSGHAAGKGSKFSSSGGDGAFKAVDVSFWEQVAGSMEHDKFRRGGGHHSRTNNSNNNDGNDDDPINDTATGKNAVENHLLASFDDSKLYQQMLKDFISSGTAAASSSSGATGGGGSKRSGMTMDPAQEAAERLKRAMRKKTGGNGDVDLTLLLTPHNSTSASASGMTASGGMNGSINAAAVAAANAKKSSVDRRASKGRKIRYVVHPKLVNFTFPVRRSEPMIGEDVWFKSLFGGVGNSSNGGR